MATKKTRMKRVSEEEKKRKKKETDKVYHRKIHRIILMNRTYQAWEAAKAATDSRTNDEFAQILLETWSRCQTEMPKKCCQRITNLDSTAAETETSSQQTHKDISDNIVSTPPVETGSSSSSLKSLTAPMDTNISSAEDIKTPLPSLTLHTSAPDTHVKQSLSPAPGTSSDNDSEYTGTVITIKEEVEDTDYYS